MRRFKSTIIILILFFTIQYAFGQNPLQVDFKYAPNWHVTSICFPDDSSKTLVGPQGQMLYDFGGKKFFPYANDVGFKTVIHILPDEGIKFETQKLYSPKTPIVETYSTLNGLSIKQESFAYSSAGFSGYGNTTNWKEQKNAPREDIVISTVTNPTNDTKSFSPMIVVNSEFPVSVNEGVITISNKKLYLSSKVVRVRQNLGEFKTIAELAPVLVKPGETKVFTAIFENGIATDLAQKLIKDPEETTKDLLKIKADVIDYWEKSSPIPFGYISIPDKGIQDLIDGSLRNIWQAREIKDGKICFQVGPTCYRGLWVVDGAFLLETATMMNKGKDAREGIDYTLSFQQPNGKFGKLNPNFWKENGIVLWTCVRHAMLAQDKEWLRSVWPKLRKTVGFIKELREMTLVNDITLDDGLIPPGEIDGGLGGAKDKAEYTNVYWNLLGLKAMVKAASWLGEKEDAANWQKEYDDFYAAFQTAAHRDMMTDTFGNKYLPIPMDRKYHSLPQRAQWAFCQAVYPGQIFAMDDPIAKGTMDMLHTTLQEGMVMGTGWIIDGIWNYFAGFYGEACLWMGDGDKAAQSLYAFANHASPLLAWREEHNPRDLSASYVGDMPHNWASAEFIRLTVHMLELDRGNELHLLEGFPAEWASKNSITSLNGINTLFGPLYMELKVSADGKSARLKVKKMEDSQLSKMVLHLKGLTGEDKTRELPLNNDIDITIPVTKATN